MLVQGQINVRGSWVLINFVSTSVHTIWGVVAGLLLMSDKSSGEKIKQLAILGVIGVAAGYSLDFVTPIIKRIATSSFVIYSGGWCFLFLLMFHWIIDIKGHKKWSKFLVIVGMNSIFIYMINSLLGGWMSEFIGIFSMSILGYMGAAGKIIHANIVIFVHWYLCYFLYKKKIFLRI